MTQEEMIIRSKLIKILFRFVNDDDWEADDAVAAITALFAPEWRRYPENVPEKEGKYLITYNGEISMDWWTGKEWQVNDDAVHAFMELPEPYNPEQS